MKKKFLALVLALTMALSLLPVTAMAAHVHVWDTKLTYDTTDHWYECIADGCDEVKDKTAHTHTFRANLCVCGHSSTHEHEWVTGWSHNNTHHWKNCNKHSACELTSDDKAIKGFYEEHSFDGTGMCVCGQASSHGHVWTTTYSFDENGHYYECTASNCYLQGNAYEAHRPNATGECLDCGYQAPHVHDWNESEYSNNDTHHWHECVGPYACDKTANADKYGYGEHEPNAKGKCVDCGYQEGHEHVWAVAYTYDDTHHWHECVGPYDECGITADAGKDGYGEHSFSGTAIQCVCGKLRSWPSVYYPTVDPTVDPTPETVIVTPNTADAGIFMAVSMSILSVTGSAVLLKKKED